MAWPYDEEEVPQVGPAVGADWLSTIPMLLGAAGSFYNPQAGAAVMGIGDYMRRQQAGDLQQRRYQQALAHQQGQQKAAYSWAQQQGLALPEGLAPAQVFQAASQAREQARLAEAQRRRGQAVQNFSDLVALRGSRTTGMPREAFEQAQALFAGLEPEQIQHAAPLIKELQGAVQGQEQAEAMLPYYIPPEQREQITREAAWGTRPVYQGLEAAGFPASAVAGSEKYEAERGKARSDLMGAILKEAQDRVTVGVLSGDIKPHEQMDAFQQIAAGLRDKYAATPSGMEIAAQATGGAPLADVMRRPGGPAAISQRAGELSGREGAAKIRTETPSVVARAVEEQRATMPGEIAQALAIAPPVVVPPGSDIYTRGQFMRGGGPAQSGASVTVPLGSGAPAAPRPMVRGLPPVVSSEAAMAISGAQEAKTAASRLVELAKNPEVQKYQGPVAQYFSTVQRMTPGAIAGEVPLEVVDMQMSLATLRNYYFKLISGAAVVADEATRLEQQFPKFSSRPAVFQREVQNSLDTVSRMEKRVRELALRGDARATAVAQEFGLMSNEGEKPPSGSWGPVQRIR